MHTLRCNYNRNVTTLQPYNFNIQLKKKKKKKKKYERCITEQIKHVILVSNNIP
jgi:hypothetical protein